MRISTIVLSALLSLPALVAGCMNDHRAADRLPPPVPATTPASATIPEGSSIPAPGRATGVPPDAGKNGASSGAGLPPDPDKDKPRGNTPPGMDRSGGGPADGAIRDPAGAVTKQPEPKAPIN